MTSKRKISHSCKTNVVLTETNLTWTINNASFRLMDSTPLHSPVLGIWRVEVSRFAGDSGFLRFGLRLEKEYVNEKIGAKFELFLPEPRKEVALTKPVFCFFDDQFKQHYVQILMPVKELIETIANPEDALTFHCRVFTKIDEKTFQPATEADDCITMDPCQMQKDFNIILEDHFLADVTLVVEGKRLEAHKAILAARVPYFRDMFTTNQDQLVTITDMKYKVAKQMLQIIYTGKAQNGRQMAQHLLDADKYAPIGLKEECEQITTERLFQGDIGSSSSLD